MRTVSRLRLLYFLLFTSLLMCCPLCYSLPCRNHGRPIIKYTSQYIDGPYIFTIPFFGWSKGSLPRLSILSNTSQEMYSIKHTRTTIAPKKTWKSKCYANVFYGGPGGSRTRVQNTFLSASYSNNLQYIFIQASCQ